MNGKNAGYCEICGQQYGNLNQHTKTKKHIANAKELAKPEADVKEDLPEVKEDLPEVKNEVPEKYQIQIIGNESKKEKSGLDRLLDTAFSEQYAPITMSLLNNVALILQSRLGAGTQPQQTGAIVELVGGGKITVPNPNF